MDGTFVGLEKGLTLENSPFVSCYYLIITTSANVCIDTSSMLIDWRGLSSLTLLRPSIPWILRCLLIGFRGHLLGVVQ